MTRLAIPALLVALTGCETFAVAGASSGTELIQDAQGYLTESHNRRREVREKCWAILVKEVDALETAGKYREARERLKANYPPLVTISIVKAARDDPSSILAEPFGCE